jgi:hypothetical protein
MAQRLFGGHLAPRGENQRAKVAELEDLAQKSLGRYTRSVPGAERMSRWRAMPLKAARLADARSGNKDISGKIDGLDGAPERSWRRTVTTGPVQARRDMQDDR